MTRGRLQRMIRTCRTGFTLIELMVAVVVLLVIMVAVGRIFSTTSDISATGQAISETLQQGIAIEQQLREDISHLSRDGFFAIRSVAMRNDLKGEFLLLDDSLPPGELIRCDQLIFFTDGISTPMLHTNNGDFAGQGLATRVYYGHGLRFPQLEGHSQGLNAFDESDDPVLVNNATGIVTPWYEGSIDVETRKYTDDINDGDIDERFLVVASGFTASGSQQRPSEWTLCRQAIVLADDDIEDPYSMSKTAYLRGGISSHTIFPWEPRIGGNTMYPQVMHGRVDIAATQLDDIRQSVVQEVEAPGVVNRRWRENDSTIDQQELIASMFYWPRVEPYPPTTIRYDQALMFSALAEGCVSFKVEWTYDDGVGEATDAYRNWYRGYTYDPVLSQPWFGEARATDPGGFGNQLSIYFDSLSLFTSQSNAGQLSHYPAETIDPAFIEPVFAIDDGPLSAPVPTINRNVPNSRIAEYWAIFGYNSREPFFENQLDLLNDGFTDDAYLVDAGLLGGDTTRRYTPWPSALRITMRLLDRDDRLGSGWTYQFVVDLPERKQ